MKSGKKRSLLQRLQETQFALVELQLYLDTNPNDRRALAQFNALSAQLHMLKNMYERKYGPLLQYGFSPSPGRWAWYETPWPWEIEY